MQNSLICRIVVSLNTRKTVKRGSKDFRILHFLGDFVPRQGIECDYLLGKLVMIRSVVNSLWDCGDSVNLQKSRSIMILSMTGFGKSVTEVDDKKITVEIKSLNSKQLDLSIRIPQQFRNSELPLRGLVASKLERGKVDLSIVVESLGCNSPTTINKSLAVFYKSQIEDLSNTLDIPLPSDWYATLLRMPDILKTDASEVDEEETKALDSAVEQAIDGLIEFRTQEGHRLDVFFREKIGAIQKLLDEVPKYEEERVPKIKARIEEALSKINTPDYDKNRLEQEMIYYIEKLDITEEKLRLQNHLDYFLATMDSGHGQGKKLGFISQEMGREINTLGSKANQAELQRLVVMMKDQLEQIKEQVLNVM